MPGHPALLRLAPVLPWRPWLGSPLSGPCGTQRAARFWGSGTFPPSPSPAQPTQAWEAPSVVSSLPGTGEGPDPWALVSPSEKRDCNIPATKLWEDELDPPAKCAQGLPPPSQTEAALPPPLPSPQPGPPALCWGAPRPWPSPSLTSAPGPGLSRPPHWPPEW